MSWKNILKAEPIQTRNTSKIRNIKPNFSDISDLAGVSESIKPSLRQIIDLSRELEAFEERAAIIEFDGEKPRNDAEQLAYELLMEKLENKLCFSWLIFNKHNQKLH